MECVKPTDKDLHRGSVLANYVVDGAKLNI